MAPILRFAPAVHARCLTPPYFNSPAPQTMRMQAQATRPPPKNPMSAAGKITRVVTDLFLPIADGYVPAYTPLSAQPDAEELLLLERVRELFPDAMQSRELFVDRMCHLYDGGRQGAKRARTRVRTEAQGHTPEDVQGERTASGDAQGERTASGSALGQG